jgi:hypothetical protein
MMGRKRLISPKGKVNTSQSKENSPPFLSLSLSLSLVSVHPEAGLIEIRRRSSAAPPAAASYSERRLSSIEVPKRVAGFGILNFPGL